MAGLGPIDLGSENEWNNVNPSHYIFSDARLTLRGRAAVNWYFKLSSFSPVKGCYITDGASIV